MVSDGNLHEAGGDGPSPGGCYTLEPWQSSAPVVDSAHVSHPLPSFAVGGFFLVHTRTSDGNDRILKAAKRESSGALGSWKQASADHGGGLQGFTALVIDDVAYHFRNGHIARYPIADGVMEGEVDLLEDSMDTSFGGERYVWDSAVLARFSSDDQFVFHLGGYSFTAEDCRNALYRSGVAPAGRFDPVGRSHPASCPGKAAFVPPLGEGPGSLFTTSVTNAELWRAEVESNGTVGAFARVGALPAGTGNQRGDVFVYDRTLFVIRGATVLRALVRDDGTLSAWKQAASLPEAQIDVSWADDRLEGPSYAIVQGWVYVTGPKRVYYSRFVADDGCS